MVYLILGLQTRIVKLDGMTIVPPSMIRSSQQREVVALPIADLKEDFVFALVQHRLKTLSAAANVIIRSILTELKPGLKNPANS